MVFISFYLILLNGSLGPSHFIFEINVRKSRIPNKTTLKLNGDYKSIVDDVTQIQSRSMSDPPLSDIDFR